MLEISNACAIPFPYLVLSNSTVEVSSSHYFFSPIQRIQTRGFPGLLFHPLWSPFTSHREYNGSILAASTTGNIYMSPVVGATSILPP